MTQDKSLSSSDPFPLVFVNGGPMSAVYAFSARDAATAMGEAFPALGRVLDSVRGRRAPAPAPVLGASTGRAAGGGGGALVPYQALNTTWHFRLLHVAGLLVTLPLVAASRLLPGHWHCDESVFVETNRAVLTALGFAFMA